MDHRIGDNGQVSCRHRHGQQRRRGLKGRADRTATPTTGGIKAGGSIVDRTGQDGATCRNAGNVQVTASRLDQQFTDPRCRRLVKHARRRVGMVFEPIIATVYTNHGFSLVVIACQVVVGNGPVDTEPIARLRLEVVGPHAKRIARPVIGATTQHATAPPQELGTRCTRIRFAGHFPTAIDGCVVIAKRLVRGAGAAQWRIDQRGKHRRFLVRVVGAARLEHQHAQTF